MAKICACESLRRALLYIEAAVELPSATDRLLVGSSLQVLHTVHHLTRYELKSLFLSQTQALPRYVSSLRLLHGFELFISVFALVAGMAQRPFSAGPTLLGGH